MARQISTGTEAFDTLEFVNILSRSRPAYSYIYMYFLNDYILPAELHTADCTSDERLTLGKISVDYVCTTPLVMPFAGT